VQGDPNLANAYKPPTPEATSSSVGRWRSVAILGSVMVTFDVIVWLGEFHEVRFPMFLRLAVNLFLVQKLYLGRTWARFALAFVSAITLTLNSDKFVDVHWSIWTCVIFLWLAFHFLVIAACLVSPRAQSSASSNERP
jgi:hypothetical protein